MSYDVPREFEPQIEQVALTQHITTNEAFVRIIRAGLEQFNPRSEPGTHSNASLFGSVTGAGAHGSKEAVDRYIADLRAEW